MPEMLDAPSLQLFLVFVMPGLVSISLYRLLLPVHSRDWQQALSQGVFFSALNFVLLYPLIVPLVQTQWLSDGAWQIWLRLALVLLVAPVIWPLLMRSAFRHRWLARRLQLPYPTAWD